MSEMMGLVDKNIKIIIINMVFIFTNLKRNMNVI